MRRRVWIRRFLLRSAAAVAVPSQGLRDVALTRWKVPANRVHYLPNGVDLALFRPREPEHRRPVVIGHKPFSFTDEDEE